MGMDEKYPAGNPGMPLIPPRRGLSPGRFLLAVAYLVVVGFIYCFFQQNPNHPLHSHTAHHHAAQQPSAPETVIKMVEPSVRRGLVPLEAHIMSKCPDAKDCLRDLVLPVMQKTLDKVNFTLSFIGRPTEHDDGVACKHGAEECLGNIIELCAQSLYPDPKTYLGFVMCLTKDYRHIPQRGLIEDCALEHAIDFDKLNECATKDDGAYGMGMLRSSVRRTSAAGVTKSCTVRLNEEIYCVRDNGQWKECPHGSSVNDLVIAIEKLYHRRA
ncbi:hypothetical protein QC763_0027840 [Podospora pseudopauciseta]|uniref:Gamma interferon inducible lysosomal thiol reductase n=2 Tax=Podospora TaxID=5144 RepID=A0ABR0I350_9PEZI|nr:hypothetical protein QC763_0027840 [Podospora pseudopauciseta]KAK4683269.1 hypothetical protein QC764_0027730 [Podospora pseudoanserina]